MTFYKRLLATLAMFIALTTSAYAANLQDPTEQDGERYNQELNERDWIVLRNFVNSKRTSEEQEKACNLTISGDVRTEWRHLCETQCGRNIRGGKAVKPSTGLRVSRNDFDVEFNLRFDYVCERTWAVAHVQFDNSSGVDNNGFYCFGESIGDCEGWHGSGECDDICLKRAYWGYNICSSGDSRFDIEVGRRNMYTIFDSKVQYLSRFDGILLKYSDSWEWSDEWYWNTGAFVIDERCNHFGFISEVGFLNIKDSGFDFKYSFIHWPKYGKNICFVRNPRGFRFLNSQFSGYYHFDKECFGRPAYAYAAIIINHTPTDQCGGQCCCRNKKGRGKGSCSGDSDCSKIAARTVCCKRSEYCNKKNDQNLAWYIGMTIGEVKKEGDWAIDMRYEVVQAFAIPDDDVSGISRGNVFGESFTRSCRGNGNYYGFRLEGLYALTDNLSIDAILEYSRAYKKSIGGSHSFSKCEVEAIYAF